MELFRTLTTKEKALKINLDSNIYGSFAEIGAGQETAALFFKAGSASGTIAKTMSAYDMKFSDAIYGKSRRYVCEERLLKMLDHEMELLLERLPDRLQTTKFFVFANTVETLNFHRTNQGHGWLGYRFQLFPNTPMNECVIHVLLHDNDPMRQQQALGVLGVNLIYGCMFSAHPEELMQSLVDNLSVGRIEIDFFRLKGPGFTNVDNRLMALKLVKLGLTRATMFDEDGTVLQPQDALYKKNVLILKGTFRPITNVSMDMLQVGYSTFNKEEGLDENTIVSIAELTLHDLSVEERIDDKDFLQRVDILGSLGQKVMISDYQKYYMLANYISQITKGNIGIIMGVFALEMLFDETYYSALKGGILEALGTLFKKNIRLYVYPSYQRGSKDLYTSKELKLPGHLDKLFQYLCDCSQITDVQHTNPENLSIRPDHVLEMIKNGKEEWEKMVPEKVVEIIKSKGLFDYKQR